MTKVYLVYGFDYDISFAHEIKERPLKIFGNLQDAKDFVVKMVKIRDMIERAEQKAYYWTQRRFHNQNLPIKKNCNNYEYGELLDKIISSAKSERKLEIYNEFVVGEARNYCGALTWLKNKPAKQFFKH